MRGQPPRRAVKVGVHHPHLAPSIIDVFRIEIMKGRKTGGRVKGTRNRTTVEVQSALLKLLDDNIDKLGADIKALNPRDRANLLLNLAKHITPPAVNPEKLTEDQLQQVVEYIKRQKNEQEGRITL